MRHKLMHVLVVLVLFFALAPLGVSAQEQEPTCTLDGPNGMQFTGYSDEDCLQFAQILATGEEIIQNQEVNVQVGADNRINPDELRVSGCRPDKVSTANEIEMAGRQRMEAGGSGWQHVAFYPAQGTLEVSYVVPPLAREEQPAIWRGFGGTWEWHESCSVSQQEIIDDALEYAELRIDKDMGHSGCVVNLVDGYVYALDTKTADECIEFVNANNPVFGETDPREGQLVDTTGGYCGQVASDCGKNNGPSGADDESVAEQPAEPDPSTDITPDVDAEDAPDAAPVTSSPATSCGDGAAQDAVLSGTEEHTVGSENAYVVFKVWSNASTPNLGESLLPVIQPGETLTGRMGGTFWSYPTLDCAQQKYEELSQLHPLITFGELGDYLGIDLTNLGQDHAPAAEEPTTDVGDESPDQNVQVDDCVGSTCPQVS